MSKLKSILKNNIFLFRELSYIKLRNQYLHDPGLGIYYLKKLLPREFINNKDKSFKLLDVGCSWGRFGAMLAKHGFSVYGMDVFTAQMSFWTKIHKENKTAYFAAADAQYIPFKDNQFDGCTTIGVLEFIKDDRLFFRELQRVLKPKAVFVLQVTNHNNLYTRLTGKWLHKDYKRCYNLKEITSLLNDFGFLVFYISGEGWRLPVLSKILSVFLPYFKTLSYHSKFFSNALPLRQQTYITIFARKG